MTDNDRTTKASLGLRRIASSLTVFGLAAMTTAACSDEPAPDTATVSTDRGPVRGTVADDYRSFRGIPFAAAPTGELRWSAPQPAVPWRDPRAATTPGNACAQPADLPISVARQDEDCLNLDVVTPKSTAGRALPVLVWIHGGSFTYGAGSQYDAATMAAAGEVVVVTINYRLGAFGFLNYPALNNDSGNLGLQDQRAALQWVQRNAAAFGGDPRNVTLMGQSGGGYSVCAHLAAPASAGLFHRAIIQSAPCAGDGSRSRQEAEQQGIGLATRAGCPDLATAADCLRTKSATELLAAAGGGHDDYRPVIDGDLLPLAPREAFATGRFNKVPVLLGSNRDEVRGQLGGMEAIPGAAPLTADDYAQQVRAKFGAHADQVLSTYPVADFGSPSAALAAVLTDHGYSVPTLDTLALLAAQVPTYAYEFAEQQTPYFPGISRPSFPVGANHMHELPYLFTVDYMERATQQDLSDSMIAYWTRFARTAIPDGDARPAWPSFDDRRYVQSLASGHDGIRGTDFAADHHYEFWKSLNA
ncbi:carboxylesterase/lipase family protein [Nocardia sp. XZ_19_385]|uniref:carboxylesterase/lipase family protein n=1 Tax=Nocardia sp. XZ_19_385 TaxID=2769488 RepID=UPI001E33B8C9|nr:carboxylesterase family protein [Nocardia sp. XZ_19_385]